MTPPIDRHNRSLLLLALPQESQGALEAAGATTLYTGIGKVNAAYTLTRYLTHIRTRGEPLPRMINFGTAGSPSLPTHSVVACTRFVQLDMDVSGLGFAPGVTPLEDAPAQLHFAPVFHSLPQLSCGSADRFETGAAARIACDVIDMEAYALAKVCWLEGVEFACVKYVTDGADHKAGDDWAANLPRAAAAFVTLFEALLAPPPDTQP